MAVAGFAGWLAAQVERRGRERIASSPVRLLLMPPIIYAGIAGYSVILAIAGLPPPLPRVELGAATTPGQATATSSITLNVIGHTGSYWYGFTQPDRRFLAIPDSVAGNAVVLPATHMTGQSRVRARVALPPLSAVGAAVFCALALAGGGGQHSARRAAWSAAVGGGIAVCAVLVLAYVLLDRTTLWVAPLAGLGWLVTLPVAHALIVRSTPRSPFTGGATGAS